MTHGSLFSGIGGFELASEWMGWDNKFHCEWNEFGKKVLKYYWPKSVSYDDITKTDFTFWRGQIDILTGGFPCQPYSQAGKRLGKEDDRHLWPEMLRAIREIQPRWVVGENVYGLINWNGGLVFDEVQADLEAAGYEVFPYVLPACGVNAPHRRDRIWFVAYSRDFARGSKERCEDKQGRWLLRNQQQGCEVRSKNAGCGSKWPTPNTNLHDRCRSKSKKHSTKRGFYAQRRIRKCVSDGNVTDTESKRCKFTSTRNKEFQAQVRQGLHGRGSFGYGKCNTWQNFPTQSPVCSRNDGLSSRLDGITFPKWRNESIKAYGNAIVPQIALQIFKAIDKYES